MALPAARVIEAENQNGASVSALGSVLIVTSVITASVPQEPAITLQRS